MTTELPLTSIGHETDPPLDRRPTDVGSPRGRRRSVSRSDQSRLPRGRLLPDEIWLQRHRVITILALLHAPAIVGFGVWQRYDLGHVIGEAPVAIFAVAATQERLGRLLRSIAAA